MKKVKFGKVENKDTHLIKLIKVIKTFLSKNGIALTFLDSYISYKQGVIMFDFTCANREFTKSIGLFLLVMSRCQEGAYIQFNGHHSFKLIEISKGEIGMLIQHIEDHMEVEIV